MSSPDFPVEIWQHISSFLPSNFVKTLYSVNRPFLQLALEARYRVHRVSDFDRFVVRGTLLDQHVRQRARVILINDDWEKPPDATHANEPKKERPGRIRSLLSKLSLHSRNHEAQPQAQPTTEQYTPEQYYDALMLAVPDLIQIKEINLRLYTPQNERYLPKIRLTRALLETAGANLTKLSIHVGLEDLHQVLPRTSPVLPQLLHLRVVLRAVKETLSETFMLSVVQPFLVNQSSKLQSLELIGAHMVHPSILLQNLPHFPKLLKLYLSHHILNGAPQSRLGFNQFITLHAPQLHEFRYHMRGSPFIHDHPPQWFIDASSATLLDFPQITRLTVSVVPRFAFSFKSMVPHLERYRTTLRSLRLQVNAMEYNDILDLIRCLNGSRSLQLLNLGVNCLSPTVLGQFAANLPALEELTLNFARSFDYMLSTPQNPAIQSPFELTSPNVVDHLKDWNLISLSLVPTASRLALLLEVRRAIVAALPKVRIFCEVGPEEYGSAIEDPGTKLTGVQAFNFGERY